MTAAETPAEQWRPATLPRVRLGRLSPGVSGAITIELDRLAEESKRDRDRSRRICRVREAAELLSYGGSSSRAIHRAMLILGVERRDVDSIKLANYISRTEKYLELRGWDIDDHRRGRCPCFRDPSLPPLPSWFDVIEADIKKHRDDIDRLRADVDRLINFALAARSGALPIAHPDIELEDVEDHL